MLTPGKIIFDQVSKTIKLHSGQIQSILRDISFTWNVGERVGVIGLNGVGKTTLLRLIGGLDKPTQGKVIRIPNNVQIAMVFQRPEDHFIFETVIKQIKSHASREFSLNTIFEIVDQVGLSRDKLLQPPHSLSSGQQRLVAIASALAKQAHFYILDEPMAGLDANNRALVEQALENLYEQKKVGVMVVSHHPDDLLGSINRLMILHDHELIYDGTLNDVKLETLYTYLSYNDPSLLLLMKRLLNEKFNIDVESFGYSTLRKIAESIEKLNHI